MVSSSWGPMEDKGLVPEPYPALLPQDAPPRPLLADCSLPPVASAPSSISSRLALSASLRRRPALGLGALGACPPVLSASGRPNLLSFSPEPHFTTKAHPIPTAEDP